MSALQVSERCAACGRFIPHWQLGEGGGATFDYAPDNEFGLERSGWTCAKCAAPEQPRYHVVERKRWYFVAEGKINISGPWRYRSEAQEYADVLNREDKAGSK